MISNFNQFASYFTDAQPWILRVGGKNGKKFRGSREGGVGEYASFYVFAHATDGAIEAYPLHEWYNFQPIQRYKALSAEEAEHEFGRRNKTMNFFSLMMQKRLKGEDGEGSMADGEEPRLPGKKSKELRITDADDIIMDSGDESSDSDDGSGKKRVDPDSDNDKKKAKKNLKKKSKKQKDSDDEAFEDSDDGDEEGRELDYIESSSDDSDLEMKTDKQMKSVAEEDGLRKLLTSDESSDEEKNTSDESNKEDKKETTENETKTKKKKNLSKKANKDGDKKESLSDLSSNSEDSDNDSKKKNNKFNGNSASNSRSASPSLDGNSSVAAQSGGLKRKIQSMPTDLGIGGNSNGASENSNSPTVTPAKKAKYDAPQTLTTFAGAISGNRE